MWLFFFFMLACFYSSSDVVRLLLSHPNSKFIDFTDKDNNGAIDIKEALFYFLDNNLLTSVSEFTKGLQEADKNGDSFISPKEFDNSLEDYPEKNLTATFTL